METTFPDDVVTLVDLERAPRWAPIVELFPVVGRATRTYLGGASFCAAGPHSPSRSTIISVEK